MSHLPVKPFPSCRCEQMSEETPAALLLPGDHLNPIQSSPGFFVNTKTLLEILGTDSNPFPLKGIIKQSQCGTKCRNTGLIGISSRIVSSFSTETSHLRWAAKLISPKESSVISWKRSDLIFSSSTVSEQTHCRTHLYVNSYPLLCCLKPWCV